MGPKLHNQKKKSRRNARFQAFFCQKPLKISKIGEQIAPNLFGSETVDISEANEEAIAYFGLSMFPSEFLHTRETQTCMGSWNVSYPVS